MPAEVNPDECVGCGSCESVCPTGAISMEDELAVVDADKCDECETCVEECPVEAISMKK